MYAGNAGTHVPGHLVCVLQHIVHTAAFYITTIDSLVLE